MIEGGRPGKFVNESQLSREGLWDSYWECCQVGFRVWMEGRLGLQTGCPVGSCQPSLAVGRGQEQAGVGEQEKVGWEVGQGLGLGQVTL